MSAIVNSKKTATVTFRIDEELLSRLRFESKNQEISTNTLVNQVFRRFLEWDIYQPKIGLVSITKPVFVKIFEGLTEDEVIRLARTIGKDEARDVTFFMKGKVDIDSFMAWFEIQMLNSSVQTSHTIDSNIHMYVMKHDLGRNWSVYHKTILEIIFDRVFNKRVEIRCGSGTITLRFAQ